MTSPQNTSNRPTSAAASTWDPAVFRIPTVIEVTGLLIILLAFALAPRAAALEPEWAVWYDSGQADQAQDMAVGADGTMFLTGTRGTGSGSDIQTVAFAPDGSVLWTALYDGPASDVDLASAVATDGAEWVYVVGRAKVGFDADFVTIKYAAADGAEVWTRLHDVEGIVADEPADVAVGPDGSVFVTGRAYTSSEQNDYETVKYDPDGNLLWSTGYSGPGPMLLADDTPTALIVDSQGNVIVTGSSNDAGGHPDYLTIKYDGATGNALWTRRYTGDGGDDAARDIAIDENDDIYVTGLSQQSGRTYATVKYSGSAGTELWDAVDDPGVDDVVSALTVHGGTVFVTGTYDPDADDGNANENIHTVARQASDGALIWAQDYGDMGFFELDASFDLVVDTVGRLQVSGRTSSYGAAQALLLLTYDTSSGDLIEASTWERPGDYADIGWRIAIDPTGDILIGGFSSSGDLLDMLALRYQGREITATPPGRGSGSSPVILGLGPNPVSTVGTVRFALPRGGFTKLELFDVRGRRVATTLEGDLSAGEHSAGFDVAPLASGRYFLRLHTAAGVATRGLVVMR